MEGDQKFFWMTSQKTKRSNHLLSILFIFQKTVPSLCSNHEVTVSMGLCAVKSIRTSYMMYGVCLQSPRTTSCNITSSANHETHDIRHFFSKQPENTKRLIVHFIFMKLQYFTAWTLWANDASNNPSVLICSDLKSVQRTMKRWKQYERIAGLRPADTDL